MSANSRRPPPPRPKFWSGEIALGHELESRRRQRRLGEAPPRDASLIGATFRSAAGVNSCGEEGLILHAPSYSITL
jgi:hypothetical protein